MDEAGASARRPRRRPRTCPKIRQSAGRGITLKRQAREMVSNVRCYFTCLVLSYCTWRRWRSEQELTKTTEWAAYIQHSSWSGQPSQNVHSSSGKSYSSRTDYTGQQRQTSPPAHQRQYHPPVNWPPHGQFEPQNYQTTLAGETGPRLPVLPGYNHQEHWLKHRNVNPATPWVSNPSQTNVPVQANRNIPVAPEFQNQQFNSQINFPFSAGPYIPHPFQNYKVQGNLAHPQTTWINKINPQFSSTGNKQYSERPVRPQQNTLRLRATQESYFGKENLPRQFDHQFSKPDRQQIVWPKYSSKNQVHLPNNQYTEQINKLKLSIPNFQYGDEKEWNVHTTSNTLSSFNELLNSQNNLPPDVRSQLLLSQDRTFPNHLKPPNEISANVSFPQLQGTNENSNWFEQSGLNFPDIENIFRHQNLSTKPSHMSLSTEKSVSEVTPGGWPSFPLGPFHNEQTFQHFQEEPQSHQSDTSEEINPHSDHTQKDSWSDVRSKASPSQRTWEGYSVSELLPTKPPVKHSKEHINWPDKKEDENGELLIQGKVRLGSEVSSEQHVPREECEGPDGHTGHCVPVKECDLENSQYRDSKYSHHFCILKHEQSIGICCLHQKSKSMTAHSQTDSSHHSVEEDGSDEQSLDHDYDDIHHHHHHTHEEDGSDEQSLEHDYDDIHHPHHHKEHCIYPIADYKLCGSNGKNMSNITTDSEASVKDWPWSAVFVQRSNFDQFCGGTLITRRHVLTAAHCFGPVNPDDALVVLGDYNVKLSNESRSRVFAISQVIRNDDYDAPTHENDIAIVVLNGTTVYNTYIQPACLPAPGPRFTNATAVVTGWGTTVYKGQIPRRLREVAIPVWDQDMCSPRFAQTIFNTSMCAGAFEGGKDSCQGDSGGPLVKQCYHSQRWVVIGVVSWGIRCGELNKPGIYVRVNEYLDWIHETIDNTTETLNI